MPAKPGPRPSLGRPSSHRMAPASSVPAPAGQQAVWRRTAPPAARWVAATTATRDGRVIGLPHVCLISSRIMHTRCGVRCSAIIGPARSRADPPRDTVSTQAGGSRLRPCPPRGWHRADRCRTVSRIIGAARAGFDRRRVRRPQQALGAQSDGRARGADVEFERSVRYMYSV